MMITRHLALDTTEWTLVSASGSTSRRRCAIKNLGGHRGHRLKGDASGLRSHWINIQPLRFSLR